MKSNYETDLLKDIVDFTAKLAGRKYEAETQEGFAMRVIADHARATAFSIADGILPGNEGRNYVLRKIMRRAIYQGRETLSLNDAFFYRVTNFVVEQMKDAYPELDIQSGFIEKMVLLEEERFRTTLTVGLNKLTELITTSRIESGEIVVPTLELARLYDTYGTPIDLMYVVLSKGDHRFIHSSQPFEDMPPENVLGRFRDISEEVFRKGIEGLLKKLQESNVDKQDSRQKSLAQVYVALSRRHDTKSEFRGYEAVQVDTARIVALIKKDDEVQEISKGDEGEVILDQTPFYAESGGQVGDVGKLTSPPETEGGSVMSAVVEDTYSPAQGLIVHKVKVERGNLNVGDTVTAQVDVEKRDATRRNHTATHLLHAALREVLGTHVKQGGSVVAPNYLRFDFSHFQPLTHDEISEIERLVNYQIIRNEKVQTDILTLEEAMQIGSDCPVR